MNEGSADSPTLQPASWLLPMRHGQLGAILEAQAFIHGRPGEGARAFNFLISHFFARPKLSEVSLSTRSGTIRICAFPSYAERIEALMGGFVELQSGLAIHYTRYGGAHQNAFERTVLEALITGAEAHRLSCLKGANAVDNPMDGLFPDLARLPFSFRGAEISGDLRWLLLMVLRSAQYAQTRDQVFVSRTYMLASALGAAPHDIVRIGRMLPEVTLGHEKVFQSRVDTQDLRFLIAENLYEQIACAQDRMPAKEASRPRSEPSEGSLLPAASVEGPGGCVEAMLYMILRDARYGLDSRQLLSATAPDLSISVGAMEASLDKMERAGLLKRISSRWVASRPPLQTRIVRSRPEDGQRGRTKKRFIPEPADPNPRMPDVLEW